MGHIMDYTGANVRAHKRKRTPVEGAEEKGWQAAMARERRIANPYTTTRSTSNFVLACYDAWNRGWNKAYDELCEMKKDTPSLRLPRKD